MVSAPGRPGRKEGLRSCTAVFGLQDNVALSTGDTLRAVLTHPTIPLPTTRKPMTSIYGCSMADS